MRYGAFRIQNFRGIVDTRIDLESRTGARSAVSLVGLNESGKTTILEAIHSFSPDETTTMLLSGKTLERVPPESLIPRKSQADFSGAISVTAEVVATPDDYQRIRDKMRLKHGLKLDIDDFPSRFTIERRMNFKTSKYLNTRLIYGLTFSGVEVGKQKSRPFTQQQIDQMRDIIAAELPPIKYFPTFLFEFPDRIMLNGPSDGRNSIYRSMFQDVLYFTKKGYDIETHIINRLEYSADTHGIFSAFMNWYYGSYNKAAIDSVMSEASAKASAVVMKRWNEVFTDKIKNKEIIIDFEIVKPSEGEEPLGSIRFWVKEGLDRFKVSERSLGFRWFLCFLLFTQFISAENEKNALYLFDEPASNLHARAQQQLLDRFSVIVENSGGLVYSTHSHHMISPSWLEMAYIVQNSAISYDKDEFEYSIGDETEIEAVPYRQFANEHPNKRSYFQPILDRLDYAPSDLEFVEPALMVEGKSDFYTMRYFFDHVIKSKKIKVMPGTGATGLGPLIELYLGWGKKFIVTLDGDKAGKESRDRYEADYLLPAEKLALLPDLVPSLSIRAIESMIADADKGKIAVALSLTRAPSKKDLARYFQEALATGKAIKFSKATVDNFKALEAAAVERLEAQQY